MGIIDAFTVFPDSKYRIRLVRTLCNFIPAFVSLRNIQLLVKRASEKKSYLRDTWFARYVTTCILGLLSIKEWDLVSSANPATLRSSSSLHGVS